MSIMSERTMIRQKIRIHTRIVQSLDESSDAAYCRLFPNLLRGNSLDEDDEEDCF